MRTAERLFLAAGLSAALVAALWLALPSAGGAQEANGEGNWSAGPELASPGPGEAALLTGPNCGGNCGKVLRVRGDGKVPGAAQIFDPRSGAGGTWRATTPPATDLSLGAGQDRALVALNGKREQCGLNCGNVLAHLTFDQWWMYQPASEAWLSAGRPRLRNLESTATLIEGKDCLAQCGKVLVVGGNDNLSPNALQNPDAVGRSADLFDPLTTTWTNASAELAGSRWSHLAASLPDGRILVAGGSTAQSRTSSEVYDPASQEWGSLAEIGRMVDSRRADLIRLGNGNVLLAAIGGSKIYDPVTNVWSDSNAGAGCCGAGPSAELLPNGKVLVASEAGARLYNPNSNSWAPAPGQASEFVNSTTTLLGGPGCAHLCGRVLIAGADDPLMGRSAIYTPPPAGSLDVGRGPAAGGTLVKIAGTGLAGSTARHEGGKVMFGAVEATRIIPDEVNPDASVKAVSPPAPPGTVQVSLSTVGGSVVVGDFTYEPIPAPDPQDELQALPIDEPVAIGLSQNVTGPAANPPGPPPSQSPPPPQGLHSPSAAGLSIKSFQPPLPPLSTTAVAAGPSSGLAASSLALPGLAPSTSSVAGESEDNPDAAIQYAMVGAPADGWEWLSLLFTAGLATALYAGLRPRSACKPVEAAVCCIPA